MGRVGSVEEFIGHVAAAPVKPWGSYKESDYTVQQYANATLIHEPGPITSKNQCKLPVKTPDGKVHPGGVAAAAAVLAGARGGLKDVSDAQKDAAKKKLLGLYKQIKQDPLDSLKQDDLAGEFLEHFGVKGMKWGVRNPRGSSGVTRGEKKAQKKTAKANAKAFKADQKWQANIYSTRGKIAVHNKTAEKLNSPEGLEKLRNDFIAKNGKDARPLDALTGEPVGKAGQQYLDDYNALVEKSAQASVKEVHGVSPSGKYKATLDTSNPNQWAVKVVPTTAQHSVGGSLPELTMNVSHDRKGFITQHHKIKETDAKHDDLAGEFLEHYGVKGMHWGVRNPRNRSRGSGKKGAGTNNKKLPSTLSDEELKKAVARMELEKRYSDLASGKSSKSKDSGSAFVSDLAKNSIKIASGAATTFLVQKALKSKFGS